ncbi:hypothetical protein [Halomicronema sp. CCY15110]|uniref:hypothetical protein n=1 Tax=Halomicronema sp. CCY15110 TaxID=2767773 RepID=UPI00194F891D|nr:hypothetical protein [Halomicronema sp. CCY15110]
MPLPFVCPVFQLKLFKFYDDGEIHEATMYQNLIMIQAKLFSSQDRDVAYRFASALGQSYQTVIAADSSSYQVWVDIRCRDYSEALAHATNASGVARPVSAINPGQWSRDVA